VAKDKASGQQFVPSGEKFAFWFLTIQPYFFTSSCFP
jgi:hypothetical protein